ncbi:MAG: hypothetical protein GY924_09835 [Planctomycetaceae bacterium]|nr:hypothetical protein [Planctomycetaceae bacterium]
MPHGNRTLKMAEKIAETSTVLSSKEKLYQLTRTPAGVTTSLSIIPNNPTTTQSNDR